MIKVLHNPHFNDAFWSDELIDYRHVVSVPECTDAAEVDTDNLDEAYALTQNAFHPWKDHPAVRALTDRTRSTSVGDVMVHEGQTYVVAPAGFITLEEYREKYPSLSRA